MYSITYFQKEYLLHQSLLVKCYFFQPAVFVLFSFEQKNGTIKNESIHIALFLHLFQKCLVGVAIGGRMLDLDLIVSGHFCFCKIVSNAHCWIIPVSSLCKGIMQ